MVRDGSVSTGDSSGGGRLLPTGSGASILVGSSGHLIGSPGSWRVAPSSGVRHFPLAEPQRFGCRMILQMEIKPREHRARIVFHGPRGRDHGAGSREEPSPG